MSNKVNFTLIPFPNIQWSGDIFQLAQLLADHLQGTLDQTVFTGQLDGIEPTTDVGLWLDVDTWKRWDADLAKYIPMALKAGLVTDGVLKTTTLIATSTSDIELNLPSAAGTIARIEDIPGGSPGGSPGGPRTLDANSVNIDWADSDIYTTISGNLTVTASGSGLQKVNLWVETPPGVGSPYTITFPNTWRFSGTVLGTTDATHRTVDRFIIEQVGTDVFVTQLGRYSIDQAGVGGDTTPPTFSDASVIAGSGDIYVNFNELLAGTTPTGAWVVKKDGNVQTISSTMVNGFRVKLTLANNVAASSLVTVQYISDGSVKDIAGNAASSFGPSGVNIKVNS